MAKDLARNRRLAPRTRPKLLPAEARPDQVQLELAQWSTASASASVTLAFPSSLLDQVHHRQKDYYFVVIITVNRDQSYGAYSKGCPRWLRESLQVSSTCGIVDIGCGWLPFSELNGQPCD